MNSMQIVASQDTTEEKDLNRHATFTTYISSTLFKNIIHTVNNIISILFSSQHYDGGDREYDETCRQIACSSDTKELLSNAKPLQKSKKKKKQYYLRVTLRLSNTTARSQTASSHFQQY